MIDTLVDIVNEKTETSLDQITITAEEKKVRDIWEHLYNTYDPIGWNPGDPESIIDLKIEDPKRVIRQISAETKTELDRRTDVGISIRHTSLLVRIAKENGIWADQTAELVSLLKKIHEACATDYIDLSYPEIETLSQATGMAAELFSENCDQSLLGLKSDLQDLSLKSSSYLNAVGGRQLADDNSLSFYPNSHMYETGEELHYNHKNQISKDEKEIYSRYNIREDFNEGCVYFKSSGLFIEIHDSGDPK